MFLFVEFGFLGVFFLNFVFVVPGKFLVVVEMAAVHDVGLVCGGLDLYAYVGAFVVLQTMDEQQKIGIVDCWVGGWPVVFVSGIYFVWKTRARKGV